jgi:UbiD family decarboxylase
MSQQDWRSFITQVEESNHSDVIRVKEEVSPAYEMTAFMTELEGRGTSPFVIFENVKGYSVPVVTNLLGSRGRMALAFKVKEEDLHAEYSRRIKSLLPEKPVKDSPSRFRVYTGNEIDIMQFPVLTHFRDDPAPYITAGLIVSADQTRIQG